MKLVVIESPLGAPTRKGIERNKKYAKACMLDSLKRGEAPYASHLLFDQPGLLDDLVPAEREAGRAWRGATGRTFARSTPTSASRPACSAGSTVRGNSGRPSRSVRSAGWIGRCPSAGV